MSARRFTWLLALSAWLGASAAWADGLPEPGGEAMLTVTGQIAHGNATPEGAPVARFDRAMLEALPQHEVTRTTGFLEGVNTWRGPLLGDVLALVGASGGTAVATARDDYVAEIPVAVIEAHGAILAIDLNGAPLPEEFGPIWIAWPEGDGGAVIDHYWVWALASLEVR